MRKPRTAEGRRVVADMRAALERAAAERGEPMEFDELEEAALARAGDAADRAERLRKLLDGHLSVEDPAPGTVAKLSAEIRALDRQVLDLLAKVSLDLAPAKSARHVKAAQARWSRRGA